MKNIFYSNEKFNQPWSFFDVVVISIIFFVCIEPSPYNGSIQTPNHYATVLQLLFPVIAYIYLKFRHNISFSDIGLSTEPFLPLILKSIIFGFAIYLINALFNPKGLINFIDKAWLDSHIFLTTLYSVTIYLGLYFLTAALSEELLFNVILYSYFRKNDGIVFSCIITSLLFSILHPFTPKAFILIFLTNMVMLLVYEKHRSLIIIAIAHFVSNYFKAVTNTMIAYYSQ